ncbi:DMT family transporter [Marinobacter orientalis]|uniref:DMT family transporter n=1 Tax=Marinobacter orientalis TaxID=1928859 RepID=A0A7Y0RA31_9GAMM|nr:DMT family transporter [Marinobacter orientalis]NMT62384.1 DMT family transporter [Marinobacter orientalis]TGX51087.1 EamA family transporter [Marinobacter orientalis]
MSRLRTLLLTSAAMTAFAGNSLLCRAALRDTDIDAATFTSVRLVSGALMLWLLLSLRGNRAPMKQGSWGSALALFAYAAAFSYAYGGLSAAMGALLLFGAVQATMISIGFLRGDRPHLWQWVGFVVAFSGLVGLLLPGLTAPPLFSSLLMIGAGIAWGVYSLRAKGAGEPTAVTTGNFIRAVPMTVVLSLVMMTSATIDMAGMGYAVASGAIASGMGYAIWYMALPLLQATTAATVQLSVPVIAAVGGVLLLSEPLTLRLVVAGIAILGGIAIVIQAGRRKAV